MSKISPERPEKYRALANTRSMQMDNLAARAIFARMEAEGAQVRDMQLSAGQK